MPTIAQKLLTKISNKHLRGRRVVRESAKQCFLEFEGFLENLVAVHTKRKGFTYDDNHLAGQIFKISIDHKSASQWRKCQLVAAYRTWVRLRETLEVDGTFNFQGIKKCEFLIRNFIFDIKPFAEYFVQKTDPGFKLFEGGKSNVSRSWEHFLYARQVYWSSTFNEKVGDNKVAFTTTPFILRQSLEYRMRRMLGLSELHNKDFNGPKLRHSFFFEFVKKHKSHFNFVNFEISTLDKIFQWTNTSIHLGIMPRVWQIENALHMATPLFQHKDSSGEWVFDGAVEITDYEILKEKLKTRIESDFPDQVIEFFWRTPEAKVIS